MMHKNNLFEFLIISYFMKYYFIIHELCYQILFVCFHNLKNMKNIICPILQPLPLSLKIKAVMMFNTSYILSPFNVIGTVLEEQSPHFQLWCLQRHVEPPQCHGYQLGELGKSYALIINSHYIFVPTSFK